MTDAGLIGGTRRGQTTLDFAVGITVFLIAVAFVFTFIPGMLDPFTDGLEDETVTSNRVADSLVLGSLGDPDEPYVLDRDCTIAFFEPDNNDDDGSTTGGMAGCNYADTDDLYDRLGLDRRAGPSANVRIRLVRDLVTAEADNPDAGSPTDDDVPETLCYDDGNNRIIEADNPTSCDPSGSDDVMFEVGGDPPTESGSVVVARRVVYLEGGFADGTSDATMIVEVW